MPREALCRLSVLVIVMAASGCDNVEWGGAEIRLQPPPPAQIGAPAEDTVPTEEELREAALPSGPVLYMGSTDSVGLALVPVGEILRDSLAAFPSDDEIPGYRARFVGELLPQGTEFILYAGGARVGTFTSTEISTDESFCVPRPMVRGVATWIPQAMGHERFLAIPRDAGPPGAWGQFPDPGTTAAERQASLTVGRDAIARLGADWPGDLLNTRWALQALQLEEGPPAFAVTYLLRDRMRMERPPSTAASLFVLGVSDGSAYRAGYVWYRQVAQQGKGAPTLFEHYDWDGDGEDEILLEVLGERSRWVAALDRRGGTWTRVYEDPCGASAPPVGAGG